MTNNEKIFFEQNYNGDNISNENIEKLLNYLSMCKCIGGKQEILQCTFKKLSNNTFSFNGLSTIKDIKENRCINGFIKIYKNKITIDQEVTRLYGEVLKSEVINTKDILIKENDIIYRETIISGKKYVDKIKEIKKSYLKH